MTGMRRVIGVVLAGMMAGSAGAAVSLPAIFSDHMVVQQDRPVPVWGKALPGEKVEVTLAGRSAETAADAEGKWRVTLNPIAATGEAVTMTVAGENTITVNDVLVGENWMCAGQSNMQMRLESDAEWAEIPRAGDDKLRMFAVQRKYAKEPVEEAAGRWIVCTSDTLRLFSAVGYYFGMQMREELGRPVGLITNAVGGSRVEAWIDAETLRSVGVDPEKPWGDGAQVHRQPTTIYHGMLEPLAPFAMRGALWYQGESNTDNAEQYDELCAAMIGKWWELWAQPELPFYFVQLPNYRTLQDWVAVREAQARVLAVPGTGMAVAIDVGDDNDLHPKRKREVAARLARLALKRTYGRAEVVDEGPAPVAVERDGAEMVVRFEEGKELRTSDGQAPRAFELADAEGKAVAATGKVEGSQVRLAVPAGMTVAEVRYAWSNTPGVNLQSEEGLPVAPFRMMVE